VDDLKAALPIFEWAAGHSLESGVLAEQVDPYTNAPLSVSPLTWSHATVVSTAVKYLEKLEALQVCDACHHPRFRLRRRGTVEVKSQAVFDRLDAGFDPGDARETASPVAQFVTRSHKGEPVRATLSIDTRDCIGCDVCVARCAPGVLRMVGGKAMVDLRRLGRCDLDGECVDVCPTRVIRIRTEPAGRGEVPEPTPAEAPAEGRAPAEGLAIGSNPGRRAGGLAGAGLPLPVLRA
jgi:ferredoxin